MSDLPTIDLKGLEIFQSGTHNGDSYSDADLDSMVDAFGRVGFKPTIKAGHADGQDNEATARQVFGAPALGYVSALYRKGNKLYADVTQMPKRFASLVNAGAYRRISAEVYWAYKNGQNTLPRVLKSVAFLGADIPSISSLKEIEALYSKRDDGRLVAYDDAKNEYRAYECMYGGMPEQMAMPFISADTLNSLRRKAKADVGFTDLADTGSQCGGCVYYLPMIHACSLVEGYIEADDGCDLFESNAEPEPGGMEYSAGGEVHTYVIRKQGDKWCLMTKDGNKVIGCHDSEAEVQAQERAVQANKHSANNSDVWVTYDEMKGLCPPCADSMKFKNLKAVKIAVYDNGAKQYRVGEGTDINPGTVSALCDKFGDKEGFRTRCMAWAEGKSIKDPGGFCNDVKTQCFEQSTEARTYQMKVVKNGDQWCLQDGDKTGKCYPSEEEAMAAMDKGMMGDKKMMSKNQTSGGDQAMDEKQLEAEKERLQKEFADKEATLKKDYEGQVAKAVAEAEAASAEKKQLAGRIEKLESERKAATIDGWLKDQGTAGKLPPAQKDLARAILFALPDDETRVVKFSRDGQQKEMSPADAFKAYVEGQPSIFQKLSQYREEETGGGTELADAGQEADRRAKQYMEKNTNVKYDAALNKVFKDDPELHQRWKVGARH